jgi:hypothetical protein
MSENAVAQQIVDAAYRVHTLLGPGLLESVYETALASELLCWRPGNVNVHNPKNQVWASAEHPRRPVVELSQQAFQEHPEFSRLGAVWVKNNPSRSDLIKNY